MESAKLQSEVRIKIWQIVLFALVLAVTHAFTGYVLNHWADIKDGYQSANHALNQK